MCSDVISILFKNIIQHIFPFLLKYSFWLFTSSRYIFSLSKKRSFWVIYVYVLSSRKLSIQIFNLSIEVSLTLNLIIEVALTLIYGISFISVVPTYMIPQPTSVSKLHKYINYYLLMKEPKKLHQLPTLFQVNVWSFPQDVSKVVWHILLNVHMEILGVLSVCYKKLVTNNIYFRNKIFHLTTIKVWLIIIQKKKHC